jgi:hypothetical protein
MRETLVALVAADGRANCMSLVRDGDDPADVDAAVMRRAFGHFMRPEPGEAFAGACAALYELYPDDGDLRQEVQSIGDRNKVLLALENGVPVDWDAVELTPLPARTLGLLQLMRNELAREAAGRPR